MKSINRFKTALFIFCFIGVYFLFTIIFSLSEILRNFSFVTVVSRLPFLWYAKCIVAAGIAFLAINMRTLNIASTTVGDGQHGNARWATSAEKKKVYLNVPMGRETVPGLVIGIEDGHWIIDPSDSTALMVAPPGAGKTKNVYIPTVEYNARVLANTKGLGASLILTDSKGELLRSCGQNLTKAGYRVLYLDFRNPLYSYRNNLIHNVNAAIDKYKAADNKQDRVLYYAEAERHAKIVASSIVDNVETSNQNETSQYFTETSKGLITGLILLVSEYGAESERHIISVFKLIIELNGLDDGSTQDLQKNKLDELLENVDNDRIINFVGASMKADVRTSMNIFSSALGKLVSFIDAELEQLVCGHSPELDAKSFIEQPTAIFLICPDENTTRHFFASLFIRNLINELIGYAEERGGQLPRSVLNLWDEWGNMPPIKDIDILFTAARSRGIRSLVALQSLSQMEQRYSKTKAQIIKDSCQVVMFTFVAPAARPTAEEFSKALGDQTVQSGSITKSEKGGSTTLSMVRKPLLSPDQIIHLRRGEWVINKAGHWPIRSHLPIYLEYLPEFVSYNSGRGRNKIMEIQYLTGDKIRNQVHGSEYELEVGMFD
ncbi:type IV secretory system conjugative DNA transfer family protein (plasmid) [Oscillospiraceae bacterium MB08-C2-2]|nr:type IV secretory system conjugative DNA transfer family protein [Oscillospiraceae bacterium MB08-C2-2]